MHTYHGSGMVCGFGGCRAPEAPQRVVLPGSSSKTDTVAPPIWTSSPTGLVTVIVKGEPRRFRNAVLLQSRGSRRCLRSTAEQSSPAFRRGSPTLRRSSFDTTRGVDSFSARPLLLKGRFFYSLSSILPRRGDEGGRTLFIK